MVECDNPQFCDFERSLWCHHLPWLFQSSLWLGTNLTIICSACSICSTSAINAWNQGCGFVGIPMNATLACSRERSMLTKPPPLYSALTIGGALFNFRAAV